MEYQPLCTPPNCSPFLMAYLDCAEWCGIDEDDRAAFKLAVEPHWTEEAIKRAARECSDFIENWHRVWEDAGMSPEQAGHDFWLTRNGHGAGFWDRGIGEAGDRLTEAAHRWGECYVTFDPETETLSFI